MPLQVGTVVEWVENADKWIAGFLGKFEEGVYNVVSGTLHLADWTYFKILMLKLPRCEIRMSEGRRFEDDLFCVLADELGAVLVDYPCEDVIGHVFQSVLRFTSYILSDLTDSPSDPLFAFLSAEGCASKVARQNSLVPYAGEDHHVPFTASEADSAVGQEGQFRKVVTKGQGQDQERRCSTASQTHGCIVCCSRHSF